MQTKTFKEAGRYTAVDLTPVQARHLIDAKIARVTPSFVPGRFDVEVGFVAGLVACDGVNIVIEPKLPVAHLLWMLTRASSLPAWDNAPVGMMKADIVPAFIDLLCLHIGRAVETGLLSGYWPVDDTSPVLRGRVRLADQIMRHQHHLYPLEVTYDEYGHDIAENQVLLAALLKARQMVASGQNHGLLARINRLLTRFGGVTPLTQGHRLPAWKKSRLNQHYLPALGLAQLFMGDEGLNTAGGNVTGNGFIIRMPELFERFVLAVMREEFPSLSVDGQVKTRFVTGPTGNAHRSMRPDIVVGNSAGVRYVMDTKYKKADPTLSDLYQLNAYADTFDIDEVTLIYAEPVAGHVLHTGAGKRIHVRGIDLEADQSAILEQIRQLVDLP